MKRSITGCWTGRCGHECHRGKSKEILMSSLGWYVQQDGDWKGPVSEKKLRSAAVGRDIASTATVKTPSGDITTLSAAMPDLFSETSTSQRISPPIEQISELLPIEGDYFAGIRFAAYIVVAATLADCLVVLAAAAQSQVSPTVAGAIIGGHIFMAMIVSAILIGLCRVGDVLVRQVWLLNRIHDSQLNDRK